jgi:hypothetical protein
MQSGFAAMKIRAVSTGAALVLACAALGACGGSGKSSASFPPGAYVTLPQPELAIDYDRDSDAYPHERDVDGPFPTVAGPIQAAAVGRVLTTYYAALAAGRYAEACRLMVPSLAESMGEDYGPHAGRESAAAESCPRAAAYVFGGELGRLRAESASLKIREVRLYRRAAAVRLTFGAHEGSERMYMLHERGAWRVARLLAGKERIIVN